MNIWIVLLIVLLLVGIGGAPVWPAWQHSYGWGPSGGIGLVVLILIILLVMGRL